MLHHIKKLFGIKPKAVEAEVPYKVETPAPTPAPTPIAEQASQAVVESIAKPAKVKKAPAVKKPRAPKAK